MVPAEGPRLLQVTAVGTVPGGTPSLHPPPPSCAPSSMKWEPLCPALYITPSACWAGAGPVGSPAAPDSCAGVGPGGGHTTAAVAAGPSIIPGSRSGRSMFGTPLSVSLSLRFSLCLAKNKQRHRKGVQVNHVSTYNTCTSSGRAAQKVGRQDATKQIKALRSHMLSSTTRDATASSCK